MNFWDKIIKDLSDDKTCKSFQKLQEDFNINADQIWKYMQLLNSFIETGRAVVSV